MHISLAAEKLFSIGSFPVTNSLVATVIVSVMLMVLFWFMGRRANATTAPRGFYNAIEGVVELWLNFMDNVTQNRQKTLKFFPLVTTIFLFIMASNWFGLIPGVGTIGFRRPAPVEVSAHATPSDQAVSATSTKPVEAEKEEFVPLLRSANADLNVPLALGLISVIATQIISIMAVGIVKHLRKYFHLNPIKMSIGILELFDELAKVVSFSFRLFGNVFAGEVLLTVVAFLLPFIVPVPFYFLEVFVGFIQALVFSMLTLVFLEIGTNEAH